MVGDAQLPPHRPDVAHGGVVGRREEEDEARRRAARPARAAGASSMSTPSASSTSAEPEREVKLRLPCLATGTPAPATTNAAAVEMLSVPDPPAAGAAGVHQRVAVRHVDPDHRAAQRARRARRLRPPSRPWPGAPSAAPAVWTGVASPRISTPKAAAAASPESERAVGELLEGMAERGVLGHGRSRSRCRKGAGSVEKSIRRRPLLSNVDKHLRSLPGGSRPR